LDEILECSKGHTTEDYGDFVELVAKEVEASLDLYLSAV